MLQFRSLLVCFLSELKLNSLLVLGESDSKDRFYFIKINPEKRFSADICDLQNCIPKRKTQHHHPAKWLTQHSEKIASEQLCRAEESWCSLYRVEGIAPQVRPGVTVSGQPIVSRVTSPGVSGHQHGGHREL